MVGRPEPAEVRRGEVWWADLGEPRGSEPGYRRPVVIVQDDTFNRSHLATAIGVVLTSNLRLAGAPGNVLIPAKTAGLEKDSVAVVSQFVTVDRRLFGERIGKLPSRFVSAIDRGLKLVLNLA